MSTRTPPRKQIKRIPMLHFTEPVGNDTTHRVARGTVCECGFREFTLTLVTIDQESSLWAQCTACKQSYRVTKYARRT